jgi:hypothetical protein
MEQYIPKYLQLQEVLPRDTYYRLEADGKLHLGWYFFDERVLWTADKLREMYGPITVNTWHKGGLTKYRGWRPGDSEVGSEYSQHKFGRALDCTFKNSTAETIRLEIMANKWPVHFQHITCIEAEVSWLHFDVRNYEGLLIVTP